MYTAARRRGDSSCCHHGRPYGRHLESGFQNSVAAATFVYYDVPCGARERRTTAPSQRGISLRYDEPNRGRCENTRSELLPWTRRPREKGPAGGGPGFGKSFRSSHYRTVTRELFLNRAGESGRWIIRLFFNTRGNAPVRPRINVSHIYFFFFLFFRETYRKPFPTPPRPIRARPSLSSLFISVRQS